MRQQPCSSDRVPATMLQRLFSSDHAPCASDHAPATMLQRHRAPATILQRVVLLDPKNTEFEVGMMKLITA